MPDNANALPIVPCEGCFVARDGHNELGIVVGHSIRGQTVNVQVQWGNAGTTMWHDLSELHSGFRRGHVIQDQPMSNTRKPLGTGTVRAIRQIAHRDQVLVQFHQTGESRWLPYERLIRLRDAYIKYARAESQDADSAERFRLKALAYALDSWNQVTGALDRLDVDPLPHQIDLVHRIMTSDQTNWLIADDVGLGKTIEVGLLLAAMKRRRQARRVLVVCPAGVVKQWQEEMRYKFNEDFLIYGDDFRVNQASHWSMYDKVIVSIDRAKGINHSSIFQDSGFWDIIVFDEAHHLSKIEHQAVTQRYHLAELLRSLTDAFVFLTGTPHQGNSAQFINLLFLLRPDLRHRFEEVFTDPSVVAEVVLRNRKSLATDASGRFLFRGQDTHLVEVPLSDPARAFNESLYDYLRNGYDASASGGTTGRAIGFVMTTYRKLASSSIASIERALLRRLARLQGNATANPIGVPDFLEFEEAFREGLDARDDLDDLADEVSGASPFFSGEQRQIAALLDAATQVKDSDLKLEKFLSAIATPLYEQGQRLLIFTEYRATQEYIVDALSRRLPNSKVCQLHGSMSLAEKRHNIGRFNEDAHFMISTEAGGEGINLHYGCHIMANYDLPWNPSRLVQRSGRLYRYGQVNRVVVFNLMANDTFDNTALGMMMQRVLTIAREMAPVSSEFQGGALETDIIGELLERVDMPSLLITNSQMDIQRTQADVEDALTRAKEAKAQQERLFAHVEGYDPQSPLALHTLGPEDVLVFLEGMLPFVQVRVRQRLYDGRVLELELPEGLRGKYSEFPSGATFVRVTADRQLAMRLANVAPMDFKSPFFLHLIEFAESPGFRGEYASLVGPESGVLGLYKLRWQNDQGVPREEALLPLFLPEGSSLPPSVPTFVGTLLLKPPENCKATRSSDMTRRQDVLQQLDSVAHNGLGRRCTALRHPNDVVLLAVADLIRVEE